jgi:uncharacterized protein DUF1963
MVFLAQIDASRLPDLDPAWPDPNPWAHQGRLIHVFADLLDNPFEPGPAVVRACDPGDRLVRTAPPPAPEPWPAGGPWDELEMDERFRILPEAAVRPVPFLSAPETHPLLKPSESSYSEDAARYQSFAARLRVDGGETHPGQELLERDDPGPTPPSAYEVHHLLGEACSIQNDVRHTGVLMANDPYWKSQTDKSGDPELTTEGAWRVLLALHDDQRIGLEILDRGAFHVLAPIKDLAEGRYERLVCSVQ